VASDEKMLVVGHGIVFNALLCDGVEGKIENLGRSFINPKKFQNLSPVYVNVNKNGLWQVQANMLVIRHAQSTANAKSEEMQ
jgi:hypothetical protein